VGMVIEEVVGYIIQDELMKIPFSATVPVMEGLATFGAEDFKDFILGYVISFGIMMFERAYIKPITDPIIDFIKDKSEALMNFLHKTFIKQEDKFEIEE
jgi:hypothetical protein